MLQQVLVSSFEQQDCALCNTKLMLVVHTHSTVLPYNFSSTWTLVSSPPHFLPPCNEAGSGLVFKVQALVLRHASELANQFIRTCRLVAKGLGLWTMPSNAAAISYKPLEQSSLDMPCLSNCYQDCANHWASEKGQREATTRCHRCVCNEIGVGVGGGGGQLLS